MVDITVFLNMTKYLLFETAYHPQYIGLSRIAKMQSIFKDDSPDILNVQVFSNEYSITK